jgi:RNA polymerase sigma factor (sigma-70 family)
MIGTVELQNVINQVDNEQGWQLTVAEQTAYAAALLPHVPDKPTTEQLQRLVVHYHFDHSLVEALRDLNNPMHERAWTEWVAQAIRILRHSGFAHGNDKTADIDDLAQIVSEELAHSVSGFHYTSRFSTWAYAVISRRVQRYLRDSRASKRSHTASSLEHSAASMVPLPENQDPEQIVVAKVFAELADRVLQEQGGQRLADIFRLWAIEDWRLVDIAKQHNLSTTRVSVLIEQARHILSEHPAIQAWMSQEQVEVK